MFAEHNALVLQVLETCRQCGVDQLQELGVRSADTGKSVAQVALEEGHLDRQALLEAVAEFLGIPFLEAPPEQISTEVLRLLEPQWARQYGVLPYGASGRRIRLLALDPFHGAIVDELTFLLDMDVELAVTDPDLLEKAITRHYGTDSDPLDSVLEEVSESAGQEEDPGVADDAALASMANEAPIIRLVDAILRQAVRDQASDIHFEPYEDQFRIRYRIDGALYEMAPPARSLALPVISRLKVLSNMNIAERRVPQDGRIKMTLAGRPVDLRVSTLPTRFGESVVLRVLDKGVVQLDLEKLSMPPGVLSGIREIVRRPNGIFIVTGPTGSGKTTTLYSALREVNQVGTKILTAEDPVEYEIDGIMQVAVNHQVGLTFAKALRSFLRQDPDVIMVGEIRDLETAQIAVQASLTGHVVLSTLHTNDAPGAITRLLDMGLEPFLISASMEAVLAQRLVRRIDPDHRAPYMPEERILRLLGLAADQLGGKPFYTGRAAPENNHTGYRGRIGLFEFLRVSDALREKINQRAPTLQLRRQALREGMRTLRDDGLRAILDGRTTVEEVLKYT